MKTDEKLQEMMIEYQAFDIILAEKFAQREQDSYLSVLRAKFRKLDEIVQYIIDNNLNIWEVENGTM